jgi:2-polyprenyl-3-methyl-5-hydroxy-6-metoxy-1,4-benzoquinol methylase
METQFLKYQERGAYHYKATIGCNSWKDFDVRLAARYLTAIKMLECKPGDRILDAGSGEGVGSLYCSRRGAIVYALEYDSAGCQLGKEIALREGLFGRRVLFLRGDVYATAFPDATFDGIISLEVIEHMKEVDTYLRELRRVLKPSGTLVISTPLALSNGQLQDPYHFREFTAESLHAALSEMFSRVVVRSCWNERTDNLYSAESRSRLFRSLRRSFIRLMGYCGRNIFVGPVAFDSACPNLVASARL